MKKNIPAVFFQKHLNGVPEAPQKPERLELFESELREVVGGLSRSREIYTYSGSYGEVPQADDCAA